MTRRPDPQPSDDELLLESLQGELEPAAQIALEARLASDPELAARRDDWSRLLTSEHAAFEPAEQTAAAQADAPRLAAWIRSTVAAEETARTRVRFAPARQRGWARILAWSVGLHVVLLGVLALMLGGAEDRAQERASTHVAIEDDQDWEEVVVDPADAARAIGFQNIRWDEVGAVGERLALGEDETLGDELRADMDSLSAERPMAWDGLKHPVGVVVAMSRRKDASLKRLRLDALGYNASGTLKAVDRGLRFLGRQQRPDGSFPASAARTDVEQTALTLLAFLGDGHTSRGRSDRDKIVARGMTWLRKRLMRVARDGADKPDTAAAFGGATVALCEDYMLSYGNLPPKAAERRSHEIAALAAQARKRLGSSQGTDRTWDLWALDAAQRTGVVRTSGAEQRVFQAWVETAAAAGADSQDPMQALSAGTALLFAERGTKKPRFLMWSGANAERLVGRLLPTGRAREGDPVGDTALILLALQVAYRTY